MKDSADLKIYFWPYDIFGYLLPGFVVIAPLLEFDSEVRSLFKQRFSEHSILDVLALIGISYSLGHIVAALSSLFLERILLKSTCGYPGEQLFAKAQHRKHLRFAGLRRFFPGHCHSYPDEFIDQFCALYNSLFRQNVFSPMPPRTADNMFWNCSLYSSVHHPPGFQLAQHFVELYGFARNTCMSLILISLYPCLPSWNPSAASLPSLSEQAWRLTTLAAAVFMYINYTKLLRRQNDHIFRSFFVGASHNLSSNNLGEQIIVTS